MKHVFYIVLVCFSFIKSYGQTIIFSNSGASYTNIDNTQPNYPVVDTYGPIDISNCTSVRFSMDFAFNVGWPGSGNMESADECMGCSGQVQDALVGGCFSCWDFMHVEVFIDGISVYTELIGGAGETRQSGNLFWSDCTNGASNMTIEVTNMNWAMDETNSFSNVQVACWDVNPTADYNPMPTCEGQPLNLVGTISVPADASSHIWSGTGGVIADPNSLNTSVTGATNGNIYTLTVTDINSCTASSSVAVVLDPLEDASFSLADFCAPNSGAAIITGTTGGTFTFDPLPGDGATINPSTGVISNAVGGHSYTVKYTTPGNCWDEASVNVTALDGPSGNLQGSAILCPGQCTTFSFSFYSGTEPYTLELSVSPPGFSLPPIPGVSTSQVFTICYMGSGPFPSFDPGTFTITIPTIYSGSGSLILTGISDGSGCPGTASGSFDLTLTSGPTANGAGPLTACADMNGTATFDLTSLDNTITGGNGSLIVNWFEDAGGQTPIANPSAYVTSGGTVYAQVSNGSCTSNLVPITLIVDTGMVPFISMLCADSGTDNCTLCLTGNSVDLAFLFGNNDAYNVTVVDLVTSTQYSGTVSNYGSLSVPVFGSTTFMLLDIQPLGGCPNITTYTDQVNINIVSAPDIDPISIDPSCNSIVLPPITGSNLSGNAKYYTGPGGTGIGYDPGIAIMTSQTLYIYDEIGGCSDEVIVNITIIPLVLFDIIPDLEGCGSVVLPAITGDGVSSSAYYSTNPDGTGTIFYPGNTVNTSVVLYIFDPVADPDCIGNVVEFSVSILDLPSVPVITDIDCTSNNNTGSFEVLSPLGAEYEYQVDNGVPQTNVTFEGLLNGSHTIKVINVVTGCEQTLSFNVNCNCLNPATISLPSFSDTICVNEVFFLDNIIVSSNITDLRFIHNGTGTVNIGVSGLFTLNFKYNSGSGDAGKVVTFTIISNDPDGSDPCEPATVTFLLYVNALPGGPIMGPSLVCSGGDVTLEVIGGGTYEWSDGGGFLSKASFKNITNPTTIFVTVTDNKGCSNVLSHDIDITSSSVGRDSFAIFCNTNPVTVNLFDYLTLGTSKIGFWKSGKDTIKTPEDYLITALPLGDTVLMYIVSDSICGVDTARIAVTINGGNNAGKDFTGQYCENSNVVLDLGTLLGNHDKGGIWSVVPSGSIDLSNPSKVDLSATPPGRYILTYKIDDNNCEPDSAVVTIFVIAEPHAGPDINTALCVGAQIDLFSLLNGVDLTGRFQNINMYPGFSGSVWNTAGLAQGIYTFEYTVDGIFPCNHDVALISIDLKSALNAGSDVEVDFCDTKTINLFDYLDVSADGGGTFLYGGQPVDHGVFATFNTIDSYTFVYEVGDDIVCPKVSSVLKFNKIKVPPFLGLNIPDMCIGQCRDLYVGYDPVNIDEITLTGKVWSTNEQFTEIHYAIDEDVSTDFVLLKVCSDNSWPSGSTVVLTLESITMNNGLCVFEVDQPVTLNINDLPVKNIQEVLCNSESITIGGQEFSATHPSGEVILVSQDDTMCDTIVQVNLQFYPEAIGNFEASYCDIQKTVVIGNETFSYTKPEGIAILKAGATNGCDSIIHVKINYDKITITGALTVTTCDDNYELNIGGESFNKTHPSGQALLPGLAVGGCDSLVLVNLIFEDFRFDYELEYACDTSPATLNVVSASQSGPYRVLIDGTEVSQASVLPIKIPVLSGQHIIQVVNVAGCASLVNIEVKDNEPSPDVTLTQVPLSDGRIQIMVIAPQNNIFDLEWSPFNSLTCKDCFDPIANPEVTTTYILSYLYGSNCQEIQSITIERIVADVTIPNIFSPNNDGVNDKFFVFVPDNLSATITNLSVFDRWGNLMFQLKDAPPNDPEYGWDGKFGGRLLNPGVYVYSVEVYFGALAQTKQYSGSLTIIH